MSIDLQTLKLMKVVNDFATEMKNNGPKALSTYNNNFGFLFNEIVYDDKHEYSVTNEYYYKKKRYKLINDKYKDTISYWTLEGCDNIYLEVSMHTKTGELIKEIVFELSDSNARIVIQEDGTWFIDEEEK